MQNKRVDADILQYVRPLLFLSPKITAVKKGSDQISVLEQETEKWANRDRKRQREVGFIGNRHKPKGTIGKIRRQQERETKKIGK